jgi:hypothetical protein
MATLSGTLTLADVAKRLDPAGKAQSIGEILNQANDILDDVPWVEGNLISGHQFTQRTSLPTPTWVTINSGITPTVSTTDQQVESVGILGAVSEVAKEVAEHGGQLQNTLMSESTAQIEGMGQEYAGTLMYGNVTTAPTEFHGFAPRYNSTSGTTGQNIVSGAGAQSDNSSIWLVGWGKGKVYGIYPKGSKAGLEQINRGLQTIETTAGVGGAGARMLAYQIFYYWKCGLSVEDWRYVVRGANIDISALIAKSSAADLFDMMIKMIHRIPNLRNCTPRFYMNRTCLEMLDIQARDDVQTGGQLGYTDVAGMTLRTFRGIPIRLVDQLTEAEATVS